MWTRATTPSSSSSTRSAGAVRSLPERVGVTREIEADTDAVRRALRDVCPEAEPTGDGAYRWTGPDGINADTPLRIVARVAHAGERAMLSLTTTYSARVPYFWWIFDGLTRSSVRQSLLHTARVVEARATGAEAPPEPKRAWWSPPEPLTTTQTEMIATLCLLLAINEYANSMLTQTLHFVATTYRASDAQLGVMTAVTRVGNLLVLGGGILADRLGRRRLLLGTIATVTVATALSAAAPNLVVYGALQLVVNGGTNLGFLVGFVAAVEEAPESSRTYTIALVGIASSLGFVAGAVLLPLADIGPNAWRGLYAAGALGLVFLPYASRTLGETARFEALVARNARGRMGEVVDRRYGMRFAVVCLTGFFLNVFIAPQGQLTNRYLGEERRFSAFGILILRAATQSLPGFVAAYGGGRLAESAGRRPVARYGLLIGASATAAFFLVHGPLLWIALAVGFMGLAAAGPSLTAFSTELFPTEVRGTAGAWQTITAVSGSATGLLVAGYLAKPLGSIGNSVAVTAIGPLIVALLLIGFLPEAKGRLLDEVSPSEV